MSLCPFGDKATVSSQMRLEESNQHVDIQQY